MARAGAERPRALIVRAEGDVFSAGVDVHVFEGLDAQSAAALTGRLLALTHAVEDLPLPTLAVVHGLCLTAGLELSLACDLLWAADGAQFGLVEKVVGITPLMGGTQRMAERAGTARAREFVMTGRLYDARRCTPGAWSTACSAPDDLLRRRASSPPSSRPGRRSRTRRPRRSSARRPTTARAAPTSVPRSSHHTCSKPTIAGMRCNRSSAKVLEKRHSLVTCNPSIRGEGKPVADFLDEKRKEIQARLKELRPLVDEYHRLEAAEQALSGVPGKPATAAARHSRRRRRSSSPQRPPRPPARLRYRAAQARSSSPSARHHHPRARRRDGHQAELPVPRDARSRRGGQGDEVGPRLARGARRGNAQTSPSSLHRIALADQLGDRLVDPFL